MLFDTLVENCIVTLGWKMKFIESCKTSKGNDIDLNYFFWGGRGTFHKVLVQGIYFLEITNFPC